MNYLQAKNPTSLAIASLLNKQERRKTDITAKYLGFEVPDEFLVGYGLDYAEKYRNLPVIGILKEEIYK
jgi:hypoxanthine phosphoribosyltransferase